MDYSQSGQPIQIATPLGQDLLLLEGFTATEWVSQPFEIQCQTLARKPIDSLIHRPVAIYLEALGGEARYFHGLVRSMTNKGKGEGKSGTFLCYHLEVVPALWFLHLTTDCRVFQEKTVEEIVTMVLRESGVTHFRFALNSEYPVRRYCVQYRESNFAFISRLLEEEGIAYYFEHFDDHHELILTDLINGVALRQHPVVHFEPTDGYQDQQGVKEIEFRQQAVPLQVTLKDFDFKKPARRLQELGTTKTGVGETFEYPGRFFDEAEGRRYARIRAGEADLERERGSGSSFCRMFCAGHWFELRGHYDPAANRKYLLLEVQHDARDNSYRSGEGAPYFYQNQFTVIPNDLRYRPARITPRPVVPGAQSAKVVGPSGEVVYTDSFGRVKVQFNWDRRGTFDQSSSCWVRVSQPWAGQNWGAISLPRVGQEVLVDFLEGDPDRPVISGRLYNSEQMPPYKLPESKSKMGFKSKSIKGGGYNEISIDDTNANEGITIHAQHDMSTTILHDDTIRVVNNRNESVGVDEAVTIGNNQVLTVGANRKVQVAVNALETVGANKKVAVGSNLLVEVGSSVMINAGTSITLKCGAAMIHMNQAGVIVIEGTLVTMTGSIMASVAAPLTTVAGLALVTTGAVSLNSGESYWVQGGTTNIRGGMVKINS